MSDTVVPPAVGATPAMQAVGFGWVDLTEQVNHVINVVEKEGDTGVRLARNTLAMIGYFAGKDFSKAFALMTAVTVDAKAIVAAIREEWAS